MLQATSTRSDTAFAYGSWLWGVPTLASLTTSNTASAEYQAYVGEWPEYLQILGREQATSNTVHDLPRTSQAHTNAGPTIATRAVEDHATLPIGFRAREAIYELRRLSGLTWEDLADLLAVTRRSLHLWANGGPISTPNEKHVRGLLMVLRTLDRGTARENRSLMLAPRSEGGTFADLLRDQRFEEAVALAGRGRGRPASMVADVSGAVTRPSKRSVADSLGTSTERVHTEDGHALPSRRRPPRV